jgi:hypothetical protein
MGWASACSSASRNRAIGLFFIGGAVGSALAGLTWAYGGWLAVCAAAGAFALPLLAVDLCTN